MPAITPNFRLTQRDDQWITIGGLFAWTADSYGLLTQKTYQDSADVSVTLYDSKGNPISGLTDIPLPYVAGSQGVYRGLVPGSTFNPPAGNFYSLVITATSGIYQMVLTIATNVVPRSSS